MTSYEHNSVMNFATFVAVIGIIAGLFILNLYYYLKQKKPKRKFSGSITINKGINIRKNEKN